MKTKKPVLSLDAKAVLGSVFQHGCELSYQLIENRPPARMQAALDELIKAEMIVKDHMPLRADGSRGVKYKARVPTDAYRSFGAKAKGLLLSEPIT